MQWKDIMHAVWNISMSQNASIVKRRWQHFDGKGIETLYTKKMPENTPQEHLTSSFLQSSPQTAECWAHPHNNKVKKINQYSRSAGRLTAALLHLLEKVYKNNLFLLEPYLCYSSDYEKYGNAWPVNVTNMKQTLLTAVNNYKQWMECFSAAALRNVHHCPLSSEQIEGKTLFKPA